MRQLAYSRQLIAGRSVELALNWVRARRIFLNTSQLVLYDFSVTVLSQLCKWVNQNKKKKLSNQIWNRFCAVCRCKFCNLTGRKICLFDDCFYLLKEEISGIGTFHYIKSPFLGTTNFLLWFTVFFKVDHIVEKEQKVK